MSEITNGISVILIEDGGIETPIRTDNNKKGLLQVAKARLNYDLVQVFLSIKQKSLDIHYD